MIKVKNLSLDLLFILGGNTLIDITKAKESLLIPEEWHDVLPDTCECGHEIQVSHNLRTTSCPNMLCIYKIAMRASDMLQNLGVKGMGETYCLGFFRSKPLTGLTHLSILTATPEEHNPYHGLDVRKRNYELIQKALETPRTFRQVVSLLALPKMNSISYKLFRGDNSIQDSIKHIKSLQTVDTDQGFITAMRVWVATKLVRGGDKSLTDIVQTISMHAEALNNVPNIFNLRPDSKKEIIIAMTGSPSLSGKTKDNYIAHINSISPESVSVIRKDSVSGVEFILADSQSGTSKYLYGQKTGKLITSVEFEKHIKNIVEDLEVETFV